MEKNFEFSPEFYDMQVNWGKRLEKEKFFFEKIFKHKKIKSILDIGCGTAHHAQFFSNYADKVTAIDPSEEMIDYARKNIVKSKNVILKKGGFENLNRLVPEKFDMVVCLGNTFPILGNRRSVKLAIKSIKKKLCDDGLSIIQFLNFEPKVMDENKFYYPKIFTKNNKKYIFIKHFEYGKLKTRVDFLITVLDNKNRVENFMVNSSYLCTLRINIFLKMAENSNFKRIELLGTGGTQKFDKKKHISLYALLYK